LFFKWPNVPADALTDDRFERAKVISDELAQAEIVEIIRRNVKLRLPESETVVEGDVTQSGFTVYLGGFDWVTFPTPQRLLQKFPEFMPLPQQVFKSDDEDDEDVEIFL